MSKLTLNQWEELCEWVGFHQVKVSYKITPVWKAPPNTFWEGSLDTSLPPQDMNTLFKWMIQNDWGITLEFSHTVKQWIAVIKIDTINNLWEELEEFSGEGEDPFEALAQAIYKVLKEASDAER